jgi:hypothetical protein
MTEDQWLTCAEPELMLGFLRNKASERKLRLFAVTCCRRVWHLLKHKQSRKAVQIAERYADGRAGEEEMNAAYRRSWNAGYYAHSPAHTAAGGAANYAAGPVDAATAAHVAHRAAYAWSRTDATAGTPEDAEEVEIAESGRQCDLLRCIFGNPFRPVPLDPSWLTPQAVAIARAVYEEGCWDDLPLLADALEEAGCTSAELLVHLRSADPHVRGCWALDLVLGKQ